MAILILLAVWVLIGLCGWRVFARAGFKGYMGLLFLVPIANFVALLVLAYKDWPAAAGEKHNHVIGDA